MTLAMSASTGPSTPIRAALAGGDPYHASIERALHWLSANWRQQPELAEVAERAGMSEYHFQRVFTRWVGVSPKKFLGYLTLESAKSCLERGESVLDAAYESGLSGPSRLHDLFLTQEAVTPGDYKRRGEGLAIGYGYAPSPFGECLVMWTRHGICALGFVDDSDRAASYADLANRFPGASFAENTAEAARLMKQAFAPVSKRGRLGLMLVGSPFQIKVWEALLRVPEGALVSYDKLAASIGKPSAARAVGTAVGANPISFLIPCHRAIRKTGVISDYHWGRARKLALIGWEQARAEKAGAAA